MKRTFIAVVCLVLLMLGAWQLGRTQTLTANMPFQVQVPGLHTSCTVVASSTQFCFAGDGLWVSVTGGAYTQIGPAPVTSVNGKTGAVTLTIQ